MLRRPLVLTVALALAALLAGGALAANVKVRVEGKTQTIYGPAQPSLKAMPTAWSRRSGCWFPDSVRARATR